jgi:predicted metalloprotease with PDZ domain
MGSQQSTPEPQAPSELPPEKTLMEKPGKETADPGTKADATSQETNEDEAPKAPSAEVQNSVDVPKEEASAPAPEEEPAPEQEAKADKEAANEVTLKPGSVGMSFVPNGVISKVVAGSQAEEKGLKVGMQILTVDGEPFTGSLIMERINGDKDYKITFEVDISITLKPGRVGLSFIKNGMITKVSEGSQAYEKGIKEGMQILSIDEEVFADSLLHERIKGSSDYVLTLKKAVPKVEERSLSLIEVVFKPGAVGMSFKNTGVITKVMDESQAQEKGLKEGMQIISVDGESFEHQRQQIKDKANGDKDYKLTLKAAEVKDAPAPPKAVETEDPEAITPAEKPEGSLGDMAAADPASADSDVAIMPDDTVPTEPAVRTESRCGIMCCGGSNPRTGTAV